MLWEESIVFKLVLHVVSKTCRGLWGHLWDMELWEFLIDPGHHYNVSVADEVCSLYVCMALLMHTCRIIIILGIFP